MRSHRHSENLLHWVVLSQRNRACSAISDNQLTTDRLQTDKICMYDIAHDAAASKWSLLDLWC